MVRTTNCPRVCGWIIIRRSVWYLPCPWGFAVKAFQVALTQTFRYIYQRACNGYLWLNGWMMPAASDDLAVYLSSYQWIDRTPCMCLPFFLSVSAKIQPCTNECWRSVGLSMWLCSLPHTLLLYIYFSVFGWLMCMYVFCIFVFLCLHPRDYLSLHFSKVFAFKCLSQCTCVQVPFLENLQKAIRMTKCKQSHVNIWTGFLFSFISRVVFNIVGLVCMWCITTIDI